MDTTNLQSSEIFQFPKRIQEAELAHALAEQQLREQQAAIEVAEKAAASLEMAHGALYEVAKEEAHAKQTTEQRFDSVPSSEYAESVASFPELPSTEAMQALFQIGLDVRKIRSESTLTRDQCESAT